MTNFIVGQKVEEKNRFKPEIVGILNFEHKNDAYDIKVISGNISIYKGDLGILTSGNYSAHIHGFRLTHDDIKNDVKDTLEINNNYLNAYVNNNSIKIYYLLTNYTGYYDSPRLKLVNEDRICLEYE